MKTGRVLILPVVLILMLLGVMLPAAAHEGREVGEYVLSFGWRNEPAYAGMMNGPEVIIETHGEGDHGHSKRPAQNGEGEDHHPLEDVAIELQVEVTFGDQTMTLPLRPAYNTYGHYIADLIPTLPGDYIFRVTGTIGEVAVDETFDSADGEFSSVEPAADILFPAVGGEDRIAALEARIAELEALIEEIRAGQ